MFYKAVATSCVALGGLTLTGGAPKGGQGGRPPPQPEHWGGIAPPNFRLQYKEVPKSPLLSLFCNSVYWLKPHNNVNSRPPNLEVLPPPLTHSDAVGLARDPVLGELSNGQNKSNT